jgi:V/A-type H+-transporting ATPase subunit E
MAIKDILEKIKNDALDRAEKFKQENENKIAQVKNGTEKTIKAIEKEADELSKKKYEEEKRLKISLASLELKNKLLAVKQNLIDEAFEKALDDVKALSVEEYKELLIKAILKVDAHGNEEIIMGSDDNGKLGAAFIKELNSAFSKNGKKGNFRLIDEKRENITGCVLKDGRKETICTFESIIAGKRKELEREIASLLFKI